jgi:hypothetical protein
VRLYVASPSGIEVARGLKYPSVYSIGAPLNFQVTHGRQGAPCPGYLCTMSYKREITEAIQKLTGTNKSDAITIEDMQVLSVDMPTRTCTCRTVNGSSAISNWVVKLMAEIDDGLLLVPAVGSTVKVAYSTFSPPFVIQYSELSQAIIVTGNSSLSIQDSNITLEQADSSGNPTSSIVLTPDHIQITNKNNAGIQLNGTGYGGLVQVNKLMDNLNAIKSYIKDTLEPAIAEALSVVDVKVSTTSGTSFAGMISTITIENMENKIVQHGG